jgi:hypothetical protein
MTIRNQHGGFNEIGRIDTTDSSIVDWQKQKLATRGQIKHVQIDPRFRGMGLATKMYGEAMKQAPRGRLVSDSAQFDGGYAIWNRLQRNKGYRIRENPKADGAEDGFLSRDKRPLFIGRINPAAIKQNNLSAKLRLQEFARGEYLRRVLGGFELIPARGASDAKRGAEKLRYYRSNPAGKEIDRVRKEILSDPNLAQAYRYKDTPGLTVVDGYDEAYHFPKRSRDTKIVIDNLNKHATRGKSWSVGKGALGNPLVRAKDIDRILSAKLRLREFAGKFHLPYSVAKKIVKGIKGRGVSIVRMRNEPSNVGYRGWGDVPVAKIERGSKRSPFADLLHEAGHVDAGHLGSNAKISERGAELLKGAEGYYPRAHHESSDDILNAARSVLLREKQANRAAGKILKDSGASPEQISAFAQEQRKNFRTYRKNAWRHAVAGERIKNPSATESNVMGVLQRQAARRGVIPSDGALRSARESVQRQIRMNPINRGRDPIFGNESFGVDGSKSILPLTISEAKRIHKNTSKLWRVREFARGDYAIPALGKMLRDRSMLEEFLTGKRGPKMGDLSVGKIYPGGIISARRPPKKSDFHISGWTKGQMLGTEPVGSQNARWRDALIEERIRGRKETFKKNRSSLSDVARNVPFPLGLTAEEAAWAQSARTAARNNAAKMLRKGRAGGDVYEDIDRKFFSAKLRLRELARGDYAIPALGKMLRDRSMLEEFMTGKRGPKMGDFRVDKLTGRMWVPNSGAWELGKNSGPYVKKISDTIKASPSDWLLKSNHNPVIAPALYKQIYKHNLISRQQARSQIAKMIRKGRAGGDVYEEVNRS